MFLPHVKRRVLKHDVFLYSFIICFVCFLLIEANFVLLKVKEVRKNEDHKGNNFGRGLRRLSTTKSSQNYGKSNSNGRTRIVIYTLMIIKMKF